MNEHFYTTIVLIGGRAYQTHFAAADIDQAVGDALRHARRLSRTYEKAVERVKVYEYRIAPIDENGACASSVYDRLLYDSGLPERDAAHTPWALLEGLAAARFPA